VSPILATNFHNTGHLTCHKGTEEDQRCSSTHS